MNATAAFNSAGCAWTGNHRYRLAPTGWRNKENHLREITRLYQTGYSLRQIDQSTGIPRETARVLLHKAGIKMRHRHPVFGKPVGELTREVALLLGLHAGDGWISESWGIVMNSIDTGMIDAVFSIAKKVLSLEPYLSHTKSTTAVKSGKRQAREFFLNYGFTSGRKAGTVSVPEAILNASDMPIVRSFLNGLFSADGCFSFIGKSARCVLQVSSRALRDGFVSLASRVGFEFRCYSYIKTTGRNKLPIHIAYLGKRIQVLNWMLSVGSTCDSHLRRFVDWRAVIRT